LRRVIAGLIAFLAMTGAFVVLPVYAAPVPAPHPVAAKIDDVELGSVEKPTDDAVVLTDGEVQPDGVAPGVTPVPAETSAPAPTETPATPSEESPAESPAPDDGIVTSGTELPGVPALTVSEPDTDKFSTVGVTWRQNDVHDVVVQLRVKNKAGTWGEWTTLAADDVDQGSQAGAPGEDVRGGTAPYWTDDAYGIEAIVQGAGGVVPEDVTVKLIDPGTSAADKLPVESGAPDQAHAGATMPDIISRAGWGADESIRTWDPEYAPTIKAATLHHTADSNNYSAAEVPGIMRSIYAYHTQGRGWGDIGYNVVVDKFGRIFEGRYGGLTSTVIGAHAGGFNTSTFGVSMLGNYAEVDTPQVMLDAVAAVMAWKLSLYGVNPHGTTQLTSAGGGTSKYAAGVVVTLPTIFAHRDVGSTVCPGQYAYNRMGQLRDMVAARMAPIAGSPVGSFETVNVNGDRLNVAGWAYDPDVPTTPLDVGVSVDGVWSLSMRADQSRPDIATAYPGVGPSHGFSGGMTLTSGRHFLCFVIGNAGARGAINWVSCQTVTATSVDATYNPVGSAEVFSLDGRTMRVTGWSVDPDDPTAALAMHVHIDGQWAGAFPSGAPRDDIAARYPGAGRYHGWYWEGTAVTPGAHQVCIYAINRNRGTQDPLMGCSTLNVPNAAFLPVGNFESATMYGRAVMVAGWAYDQEVPGRPTDVHVHVDGQVARILRADEARPDVGAAFPAAGPNHGYSGAVQLAPGTHTVCVYAINLGAGQGDPGLGCRTVSVDVRAFNPVGNLESAISHPDGRVDVSGWGLDPDAGPWSTQIHLHVDGRWAGAWTAAEPRPDIALWYPYSGPGHGFATTIHVSPGWHTICAYGINYGIGTGDQLLSCRVVNV
jgi:hypothetical protein